MAGERATRQLRRRPPSVQRMPRPDSSPRGDPMPAGCIRVDIDVPDQQCGGAGASGRSSRWCSWWGDRSRRCSARAPWRARKQARRDSRSTSASDEIASTLKLAIQHEEDLVVSASAFVTGNPGASAAGFDRWAEAVHAMQRYPELQNIGLVELVPAVASDGHSRRASRPTRCARWGPTRPDRRDRFEILPAGQSALLLLRGRGPGPRRARATYQRAWTTARSRRR